MGQSIKKKKRKEKLVNELKTKGINNSGNKKNLGEKHLKKPNIYYEINFIEEVWVRKLKEILLVIYEQGFINPQIKNLVSITLWREDKMDLATYLMTT